MADDQSEVTRDAAWWRGHLSESAVRDIDEHARRAKVQARGSWRQVLEDEIEYYWDYLAWDVAIGLDVTLFFHPKTRAKEEDRRRLAELERARRRLDRLIRSVREKFVAGPDSLLELALFVERPRPNYELLKIPRGRPADWMIDEYAGLLWVILGEKRWPPPGLDRPKRPMGRAPDPHQLIWPIARDLLELAGGPRVEEEDLRWRCGRLRQQDGLPPAPDDDDPVGWIRSLLQRLEKRVGPGHRRFLAPPHELPLLYRAAVLLPDAGAPVERFRDLHPAQLERARQLVPPAALPIANAFAPLKAILEEMGHGDLPERLRQALAERSEAPPPSVGPAPDQPPK